MPLPPPWTGASVTPAILRWQLTDAHGHDVLPAQTAVDFSSTIPPPTDFDNVYATGTYQNFPTVGDHYFFGVRGDYIFNLTASALNTRALAPGKYTVTVSALDTCGNLGALIEPLDVARQPRLRPISASLTPLLPASTWPRHFWTVVPAQGRARTQTVRDAALAGDLIARAGPAPLITTRKGRAFGIAGAFSSWAAAYSQAERVAREVTGAYVLDVDRPPAPPSRRIPQPGNPVPA